MSANNAIKTDARTSRDLWQTLGNKKMAKYACPFCNGGYAHTSGDIPNNNEWLLWSAEAFDHTPDSIETDKLYAAATHLYKCTNCSAIAIFWNGHQSEPSWYHSKERLEGKQNA